MENKAKIQRYKIKKNHFIIQFVLQERAENIRVVLFFRDRTEFQEQKRQYEYEFSLRRQMERGGKMYITASINLARVDFVECFWDIALYITQNGNEKPCPLEYMGKMEKIKNCLLFYRNEFGYADGMFVYPSINMDHAISLQYRKKGAYDGIRFKCLERLAFLTALLMKPVMRHKKILIVYEKFSMMAQDNGWYFFVYCMEHHIEQKYGCRIFYAITRDSPDRKKLGKYEDHVLDFMSIKYLIYLLNASLLVSTDTKAHAYPWYFRGGFLPFFIRKKKLVFLQHGVTAMKRVDFLYGKGQYGACDLFVVTSQFEKDIVKKYFGYSDREILVTGFARWDVLWDHSKGSREILVNPTWRNWLESSDENLFLESDYFKNYKALLESERLLHILEKYDLTLKFYLHSKFREHMKEFSALSERIQLIAFGEEPLNQLLMSARLLITDYSSVAWDFFYQKKPVIFYQFDREVYLKKHGSYIDLETELFGSNLVELDPLLEEVEREARQDFQLPVSYSRMHERYFAFQDKNNSKRICEQIFEKTR